MQSTGVQSAARQPKDQLWWTLARSVARVRENVRPGAVDWAQMYGLGLLWDLLFRRYTNISSFHLLSELFSSMDVFTKQLS